MPCESKSPPTLLPPAQNIVAQEWRLGNIAARLQELRVQENEGNRLQSRVDRIESDVASIDKRVANVEIDLRDLRKSVDGLSNTMHAQFKAARAAMAVEFKAARLEMAEGFVPIRAKLGGRIDALCSKVDALCRKVDRLQLLIILVAVEVLVTRWPQLYREISGLLLHLK